MSEGLPQDRQDSVNDPNNVDQDVPRTRVVIDLGERLGGIDDPGLLRALVDALQQASKAVSLPDEEAVAQGEEPERDLKLEGRAIDAAAERLEAAHREHAKALSEKIDEDHKMVAHLASRALAISDRRAWWANVREWLIDATKPVDRQVTECKGPFTLAFKIIHHGLVKWERGAVKDEDVNQHASGS